jgi:glucose/arabinose dehydrogenase
MSFVRRCCLRLSRLRISAAAFAIVAAAILAVPGGPSASTGRAHATARPFLSGAKAATKAVAAGSLPTGFQDNVVFSGLTQPTAVRFAADGRIFVAEKSGLLKVFDGLTDTTPTVVADFRTDVDDYWDRGLLGLALDPGFPANPYVYVLYTYDAAPGGTAPRWNDACPTPPGPTTDGCVVSGRLVRIQLSGNSIVGSPQVLIKDQWCQQFPSHSIGDLNFGPDGKLYVSGGDGSSFTFVDYGQAGGSAGSPTPKNPCGDPPAGVGGTESPPTAEGGSLRSQSIRRSSGPVLLNGALLRVDPATGAAPADNPLAGSADANAQRVIAYGMRNPFRFTFRPGTSELWIGDVGWSDWEEIERRPTPTGPVQNFGWPCYEGNGIQGGYQSAGLNSCSALYAAPNSVTPPYYTYSHSAAVVAGDNCPTGNGSVVSAIAFYSGGSYPSAYNGALFFGDHSRNCIWAMPPGSNGLPDPTKLQVIETGASNPVDIEPGPGGDLYYVDFDGGAVHSITYNPTSTCQSGTFHAQYYNNTTLSGAPTLERCDQAVNFNWGGGSPGPGVNADGFSALWTGPFNFQAGTYTFTATADDGIRVYVDGSAVIDQWKDQSATTYTAVKTLAAGTHQIRIEYYENAVDAVAQVGWQLQTSGGISCPGQYEAQYFNNMTLSGSPVVDRCESSVNYDWGGGSPDPSVTADHFSARWVGQFDFAGGSYTFTATADDGIRVYVDGAVVIDQWHDQSPTTFTAAKSVTAGAHTVKIEYYENAVGAVAKVSWQANAPNTAPTAAIDSPPSTLTYAVGDSISFSGHATDPEQGTLPASALGWTLLIHHCTTPTDCHVHTVQSWTGVASGSFSAPDHDYPSYLELQLTATDNGGLSNTASVKLDPKTVVLTFQTTPGGLTLAVGGTTATAPFTRTVIVNSANSISASSPQTLNGSSYTFSAWSDGGAATHNITAPATATTYTATYTQQAASAPASTTAPSVSGPPKQGKDLTTTNGSWSGVTPMTFTYRWLRCDGNGANCVPISGATGSSYTLIAADVDFRIRSEVTATNVGGSTSAQSTPTSVVKKSR